MRGNTVRARTTNKLLEGKQAEDKIVDSYLYIQYHTSWRFRSCSRKGLLKNFRKLGGAKSWGRIKWGRRVGVPRRQARLLLFYSALPILFSFLVSAVTSVLIIGTWNTSCSSH